MSFPDGSDGKEYACNVRDLGASSGMIPWRRNGSLLQYSDVENSPDRGARLLTVHDITKSQT